MPEGDTIHRIAARLRATLGSGPLSSLEVVPQVRGPRPAGGESIDAIEARGKHLLISFGGGATLHTHLGMDGTWRVTTPAAGPRVRPHGRPGAGPIVRVQTPRAAAVCSDTTSVELLDATGLRRQPILAALGPDLCDPEVDLDEAVRRIDALVQPDTSIADALLDQRVAAGIGNVYRSEVLWACGIDPFVPVAKVSTVTRRSVLERASGLLRENVAREGPRRTVPEGLAVYERGGRGCRRCGGTIASRRIGDRARTVWWCSACQTSA